MDSSLEALYKRQSDGTKELLELLKDPYQAQVGLDHNGVDIANMYSLHKIRYTRV